ncbi:MAG: glycosyltransferase family 2 protein [Bacteroidales bacterium]
MTKLSIITVNLNNSAGLRKTVESIWQKQTFTDLEHIIIDGASKDNSKDVIREYQDKITYWVSEPDCGIYNAMNKGIRKATGEYLLFLNSGDWLIDNILTNVFANPFDEDIVCCDIIYWYHKKKSRLVTFPDKIFLPNLILQSLGHPSTFIHRELFKDNPYREDYKIISDWAFWIEELIIKNRSYRHINIATTYYNMDGVSAKAENQKLIRSERSNFLTQTFSHRLDITSIQRDIEAIDIISKHQSEALTESVWLQRSLRQYLKFLFKIKQIFKINR